MRDVILVSLLFFLAPCVVQADSFQLLHGKRSGGEAYVAHLVVEVFDAAGDVVFKGRTDSYGRIRIDKLDSKKYQAAVVIRKKEYKFIILIDGHREMKKIYLEN